MFDLVNGLPVHPLVVHAVVVLLPLACLGTIAIAVRPAWRRKYGVMVVACAAAATVLIPVATSSGEELEHRVGDPGSHAELGDQLIWFAIPLLVLSALLVAVGYALWLPFHDSTGQALFNMAVVGVGSGALVAALPASAAAGAPADRTGFATGMTNAIKTVGGAIASSVFAIALASTGSLGEPDAGHAPLSGYLTVWAVCSVSALVAAGCLLLAPKHVFERADEVEDVLPAL